MISVEIEAIGCYVPRRRLAGDAIREATGTAPSGLVSKPVCDPDEDALTMAIEAARRALAEAPPIGWSGVPGDVRVGGHEAGLDALAVASTSLPYLRRVQSGLLVEALGLGSGTVVTEHTTSDRAAVEGLLALCGAWSWTGASSGRGLLVSADLPVGAVGSVEDGARAAMGAGATALMLSARGADARGAGGRGESDHARDLETLEGLARIDAFASASGEDPGLRFTRRGETSIRDVEVAGYAQEARARVARSAFDHVLQRAGVGRGDIAHVALGTRDARTLRTLASALELDAGQWRDLQPFRDLGDQGANGPLASLTAALDRSRPGDRIALVALGEGSAADALLLTAGARAGTGVLERALEGGRSITYVDYLRMQVDC